MVFRAFISGEPKNKLFLMKHLHFLKKPNSTLTSMMAWYQEYESNGFKGQFDIVDETYIDYSNGFADRCDTEITPEYFKAVLEEKSIEVKVTFRHDIIDEIIEN